ncbi:lipocalin-like domain-containing protein [Vibrio palustris]|uniref:Hydroxyneurosporene synthase (CrtC) n=1 Tax=Vibrio palustris TaxID=1918946 RepID=A0A1R4B2S5_9VIBR|nr:lipocalin-like domain-containing protein [Vibrio palustris]SJL83215.1 Hydroxyneurosporene synthase (CrtC) [Vibrio palustris]
MVSRRVSIIAIVILLVLMSGIAYHLFMSHNETHPLSPSHNQHRGYSFTTSSDQDYPPISKRQDVTLPDGLRFHNNYQHEWWTLAANVTTEAGHRYGIHWQYIRLAHDTGEHPQLYLAQVTVSDRYHHWYAQRIARSGSGQAGLQVSPFDLWIDAWHFSGDNASPLPGQLEVMTNQWGMQLSLTSMSDVVLPGHQGLETWGKETPKQPLGESSLVGWQIPKVAIEGRIILPNQAEAIPVSGQAWLGKRWGNHLLGQPQTGRDWIVIHLVSGTTLSITRFREFDQAPQVKGVLTFNSGESVNLTAQDIQMTPTLMGVSGQSHHIPYQWHVVLPNYDMDFTVTAVNRNDWSPLLLPNWAGPINVSGSHAATGFMQLTGY